MHLATLLGLVALGVLVSHYGRKIMALNAAQQQELRDAVAAIGVDLDELAARLDNSTVSDDPVVAEVIGSLRGISERIDATATAPGAPTDGGGPPTDGT